jgi:hypothetical protein
MAASPFESSFRSGFHHRRLTFFPDPRVSELTAILQDRLLAASRQITPDRFESVLDPLYARLITDGFASAGAHEGAILLLDSEESRLTVAHHTGRTAPAWLGTSIDAGAGLRGMVIASQQPFSASALYNNPQHDRTFDERIGMVLCTTIIAPFYFGRRLRGLVEAMRLKPDSAAPDPEAFSPESLEAIELLSTSLGRLLDYRLFCLALGMEE